MDTISLMDDGEWGVGLEDLASNIFEFDLPVTRTEFLTMKRVGSAFGLASHYWTDLEPLVQ